MTPTESGTPDGSAMPKRTGWGRRSVATVLLVGLAVTVAAFLLVRNWEQSVIQAELQRQASAQVAVIQSIIDQHTELLESLAGLFAASKLVERSEFRRFVQPILARHPEVQGYGWNPLVRSAERAAFEAYAKRAGLPGFQITEVDENGDRIVAGQRSNYLPAFYLEPLSGNEQALGFDILSESTRREALLLARDRGQAATTHWIRLVQETGDQYGILIVRPIYTRDAVLDSLQQRRDALIGYVLGVFRVGDMIEEALRPTSPAGLDFWVFEDAAANESVLAYFHPSRTRSSGKESGPRFQKLDPRNAQSLQLTLRIPGRTWTIAYSPAPAFLAANRQYAAFGVLLSGILLTSLLGFYLRNMLRDSERNARLGKQLATTNEELKREIAERFEAEKALSTSEQAYRSLVENAPEAITILDAQLGHLIEANPHATQLFAMTREQLLSIGPAEFSPEYQPDGRRSEIAAPEYIRRAVEGETPVFEWMHKDAEGENIPCEVRLSRLPDSERILIRGTIMDIRDRKKAEGLRERLGRILDNSSNEIYVFDASTLRFTQVNASARANLGFSSEELAGMTPLDISPELSPDAFRKQVEPLLAGLSNDLRFQSVHQRKDGTCYPVDVSLQLSRHENPQVFVAILQDMSERLAAENALRESESYNRTLFEESAIGLLLCNMQGSIVDANPAFAAIIGRPVQEIQNLRCGEITPESFFDEDREHLEALERDGRSGPYEKEFIHSDGHRVPVRLTGRILLKDGKQYVWSSVEDITEYKRARDRIDHLAFHDSLTDLPNRELVRDRLEHALQLAQRNKTLVGAMFLDIDRFKTINDSLGHRFGDELLKQVAERLKRNVREADTVARFGGDEFIVIAEGFSERQQLEEVAGALIDSMREPFHIDAQTLFVTTSIGIAVGPDEGADVDTLIARADMAMYKAKESGRNNYQFHSPEMGKVASLVTAIESDLRGALERNELRVHLQPIHSVETQQPVGMEALMRWEHPERGLVSPAEFIPVMENSGMIAPASRWILQESCRFLRSVGDATGKELSIAVNFSAPCFYDTGITAFVAQTLAASGIQAKQLTMEITESTLFQDPERVYPVLLGLKDLGVQIALDDFGTGQSSLSHLRNFPIDIVKIDRGFIRDVPDHDSDCKLVSAVIAMARNLNKTVVAEGVEEEAQLAFLKQRDCDRVQGYFFSPPLPAEEMLAYLQKDATPA